MLAAGLLFALLSQVAGGAAPQSASISGRVTDKASGQPLPRMIVTLATSSRSTIDVPTDSDGRFEFKDVVAGKYGVLAQNDEHRSSYLPQWFGDAEPANMGGFVPRLNLDVAAAESHRNIDIALTHALAIQGHVLDPSDEPMGGVDVMVTGPNGSLVLAQSSTSDDLGIYRVYGLRPGRYHVCARPEARGFSSAGEGSTFVRTCHPAAVTDGGAADVTLTSQDAVNIDIRVQRVGSRSISGVVTNSSGAPADGVYITAHPVDDQFAQIETHEAHGGSFVIKGLLPGRYVVLASGQLPFGDPTPPAQTPERGYASVDLTTADTAEIAIVTSKGADVRGAVTFDGGPAPRAGRLVVQAHAAPGDREITFMERLPAATVRDDLTFQLDRLFHRPMLIRIENPPDGWVLKTVRYEGKDVTYVPTDFAASSEPAPVQVILTSRVARGAVHITDEGASPASACIIGMPAEPDRWQTGVFPVPAQPSADGTVKLPPLVSGDYLFAALTMEDCSTLMRDRRHSRVDDVTHAATRFTLTSGDNPVLELKLTRLPDRR